MNNVPSRVEFLEEIVETFLQRMAQVESTIKYRLADSVQRQQKHMIMSVKMFLRRANIRQLQKPIRRSTTVYGLLYTGTTLGEVTTCVDCTLEQFSQISRDISLKEFQCEFWPSLSATQTR